MIDLSEMHPNRGAMNNCRESTAAKKTQSPAKHYRKDLIFENHCEIVSIFHFALLALLILSFLLQANMLYRPYFVLPCSDTCRCIDGICIVAVLIYYQDHGGVFTTKT